MDATILIISLELTRELLGNTYIYDHNVYTTVKIMWFLYPLLNIL